MFVRRAAVVGAGTMGHGIAQVLATAGIATCVTDADPTALAGMRRRVQESLAGAVARGTLQAQDADVALDRISTVVSLADAVRDADVVIEAIVEDLDVKRRLFAELDEAAAPAAILATNTSSLPVSRIADATRYPERIIGMHFFNPVHRMALVELVIHERTSDETASRARELVTAIGKTPIVVRDSPGFASSRLGLALGLEAMRMVEEGVASPEDIDTAMVLGYRHPMGPLRVSDLVGLDVRLRIAEHLYAELGARFEPPPILRRKVRAGELGKKTGKGFYDWP